MASQAEFMQRLSDLLEKGYSLNEALDFLILQFEGVKKADLLECMEELRHGLSVSSMFEKLSFDRDVLSYLYFAENHGDLQFALKESSDLLTRKCTQAEKLARVLRYPLFLILIGFGVIYISQTVIGPQFLQIYQSMNMEPSLLTKGLMMLFGMMKFLFAALIAFLSLFAVFYFFYFRKLAPHQQMKWMMKVPIWNKGVRMFNSYYFSLQLSYLLKGGLSYFESLKVFEKQSFHPFFKEESASFIKDLKKGEAFESIIKKSSFYEKEFFHMIAHGQANGQLARDLYNYSQFVITNLEKKMMRIISIIQPAVFLFVGLIVLIVYLSMMLPMYQMMEHI